VLNRGRLQVSALQRKKWIVGSGWVRDVWKWGMTQDNVPFNGKRWETMGFWCSDTSLMLRINCFFSPAPRTPFRYEACWAASLKLGAGAKKHPKRVSLVLLFCYSKQHSSTAHVRATSTKKHRSTKDCECQSSWQRQICLAYVSIRPWKKNIHLYIWGVSINGDPHMVGV